MLSKIGKEVRMRIWGGYYDTSRYENVRLSRIDKRRAIQLVISN
ncbi:hypothetical protein [Fictibacillus phosphorivorans]|nr:hypothetical protein [Fictibacillus phosphorivorans]